jgi:hypothetical protein
MGMLCGVRPVEDLIQLEQAAADCRCLKSFGYYRGSRHDEFG